MASDFNSLVGLSPDMWKTLTEQDNVRESARQVAQLAQQAQTDIDNALAQQQQAQQVSPFPPNPFPLNGPSSKGPSPTPPTLAGRAREMFLKRMGGIRAEMKIAEGDYLQCHVYGEVVHVFYCFGGKPGVTQESIDLFPSDTLITQFRMILA